MTTSTTQYPLECGTFYGFHNDATGIIKEFTEIFPNKLAVMPKKFGHYAGCFGAYFEDYEEDCDFYFGYAFLPQWYAKVVDQLNKEFKNIHYEIVAEKDVPLYYTNSSTGTLYDKRLTPNPRLNYVNDEHPKPDVVFKSALFTLHMSSDYSGKARKYLQYVLHHFLRMLSYVEREYIKIEDLDPKKDEDLISFVLDINNNNRGYRSLSEENVDKEHWLRLDNPEDVNWGLTQMFKNKEIIYKQTNIIKYCSISRTELEEAEREKMRKEIERREKAIRTALKIHTQAEVLRSKNKTDEFVEGEFVQAKEKSDNMYSITNTKMILGLIERIYSDSSIRVRVLVHQSEQHEGDGYDVHSRFFKHISTEEVNKILEGKKYKDILVSIAEED